MNAHRKLTPNHPGPLTTSPNVHLSKQHQSPKKCLPEPQTFAHVGCCNRTATLAVTKQLKRDQVREKNRNIWTNIVYVTPASWNATMMGEDVTDSCMLTRRLIGLHVTLSLNPLFVLFPLIDDNVSQRR
ncbi:hypothetical protein K456DRAFT_870418 [Colletotrichum gloeosporioides 23]|nr:hypothetical protein K456DRAFT_870418 [Colletotrichum gloeosporioides 23]